jgi:hypothetical protein
VEVKKAFWNFIAFKNYQLSFKPRLKDFFKKNFHFSFKNLKLFLKLLPVT